jgi:peptidoglycan/LPS O-acetylase OafA/YrhL
VVVVEGKLEGLQIGRALAALAVAYFHSHVILGTWPQTVAFPIPGLKEHGYLGVNFFFAISGYVISGVCDKPSFSVRTFAIKRFFRLYPVYWAVILAIILLKFCGVYLPSSYKALNILYSMTLLPHGENVHSFLQVTWSLEFELMFYVLAMMTVPLFGLWGLALVLFGLVCWAYQFSEPAFSFHLLRTMNSDFLAGVLAYLLRKPLSCISAWVLILSGLLGYYGVVNWLIPFSGSLAAFLLVSGLANAKWSWSTPPLRGLIKVGNASYSLYLIHLVVFYAFAKIADRFGPPPAWASELTRFVCLGICVWLSIQAYRFIELPMIEKGNRLTTLKPKGVVENAASA